MLKSKIQILLSIVLVITLASCSNKMKTEEDYLATAKTLYDSAVAKKDNNMFNETIKTYRDFLKDYPKSEKAIFAYTQIAKIFDENLANYPEAVKTHSEIVEKFPGTKDAKQSLFLVAFIYDEKMKDKDNAIISYKKFLEKYPKDENENEKLSESARVMLQTLESGSSIDDIIKKIEANENKDTKKEEPKKEEPKKEQPKKEVKTKEAPPPSDTKKTDDGTKKDGTTKH
jgi:outer membrane protein assembly factor BamD (BamD/ComL family)